ncbi:MAG: glycosyltransferase family 25 protein [Pseudomonadota bacterium]
MLASYFDKIYIINLPSRLDRRNEMEAQLNKIGIKMSDKKVFLFPAIRPLETGEFESVGARGCFLSHLEVLKDAEVNGYERILVLEDDLNFSTQFSSRIENVLEMLKNSKWSFFYGGYLNDLSTESSNLISSPKGVLEHILLRSKPLKSHPLGSFLSCY